MNREDVLRELELLPVWKLRAPAHAKPQLVEAAPVQVIEQMQAPSEQAAFNLTISTDKNWAFILPASPDLSASQSILFNNILHALKIEKSKQTTLTSGADIDAKVIIVMGESTAQALLNTQDSLEQLRGKPHFLHNIPLILTYHPNDCLQHLPNKAKTWDDLCAALSIMNA
jgi:uracil-DNA glycosylase